MTHINKGIFPCALILVALYLAVYFLPGSADSFSLNPAKVSSGEVWRFLTYQFAHSNLPHLITNIMGLSIAALMVSELGTITSHFYTSYLLAGIFAILPLWFSVPFVALGASTAVYAAFGIDTIESKKLNIPILPLIIFFTVICIFRGVYKYALCDGACMTEKVLLLQGVAHLSGFVFGLVSFPLVIYFANRMSRKKYSCLRVSAA